MRGAAIVLVLVGMCAAGAAEIAPFTGPVTHDALEAKEKTLWDLGGEADSAIAKSGIAYDDRELDAYLQRISDRLFPEFPGMIKARSIRSTSPNAFMQPNGSTYMFVGMLNFVDNEAQLAAIMAHEGVHFIDRHGYRGYKSAAVKAAWGNAIGLGLPIASHMMAYSSIMGFSRNLEHTADEQGFERLKRAGYDVREAKQPFLRLVDYLKALEIKEPYFFADHPQLMDRVDFFADHEHTQSPPGGELGRDAYLKVTERARMYALEEEAKRRNFKALLYILRDEDRLALLPPQARYYRAVAHRLRNQAGDLDAAKADFERVLADAPEFAPAHKAFADLLARDPAQHERARALYTRFLELAPDSPERGYAAASLARLTPAPVAAPSTASSGDKP